MSDKAKECRWDCEHWCADPDGEYCGHPKALDISPFGISLNRMLGAKYCQPKPPQTDAAWNMCGQDRKLWEKRSPSRMPSSNGS